MDTFIQLLKSTEVPEELKNINLSDVHKMREELLTNLSLWKNLFKNLSVVVRVNTGHEDDAPALLEIDVRNSLEVFLERSKEGQSTFHFRDNPRVEPQYDELFVFPDRNYDSFLDADDTFEKWIRQAFPGSMPKLSLPEFYKQLLVLEKIYKEAVPEPVN